MTNNPMALLLPPRRPPDVIRHSIINSGEPSLTPCRRHCPLPLPVPQMPQHRSPSLCHAPQPPGSVASGGARKKPTRCVMLRVVLCWIGCRC
ncbi:hypothetical protein E2C01_085878 [Portunus trituberculatus]|uniref:Uncharacterized protein n=1 Tax=Portunus trituberculatus TaxID=210409 RepID=A0A5B7JEU6_PORTR|nr:hypothetical protein [Portunus trituberculatus]